jgi:hypothetical protein
LLAVHLDLNKLMRLLHGDTFQLLPESGIGGDAGKCAGVRYAGRKRSVGLIAAKQIRRSCNMNADCACPVPQPNWCDKPALTSPTRQGCSTLYTESVKQQ